MIWELCCRNLSHPINVRALGRSESAQLLVHWLQRALPDRKSTCIYEGMIEELDSRGKIIVTDDDSACMESRWIKQRIHGELDTARETWLSHQTIVPVDLEIDGSVGGVDVQSLDTPCVDPPEVEHVIRDTAKVPFWIPGAFPTIFQNETGDPHTYILKEPDLTTWWQHVMRSCGWYTQGHTAFR